MTMRTGSDLYRAPVKARENPEAEQHAPLWLITLTDVVALMLTFFVLMYAMSVPEEEKWEEVTSAMSGELNRFLSQKWEAGQSEEISIGKLDESMALDLSYLHNLVTQILGKEKSLERAVLTQQRDQLVISLPEDLLFAEGKIEVTEEGNQALFALGGALSRIRNRIEVIGRGASGDDAWRASLQHSAQIAAILENVGYRRTITVRGFAEQEAGQSVSRRIDIVIMKDGGQNLVFDSGF